MCPQTAAGTIDLATLSEAQRGFFVPHFELRIENAGLPQDVLRDVREITYEDDVDQLDSFSMVVSNVDDIHHALPSRDRAGHRQRRFRYIGSEEASELEGSEAVTRYKLFEPCARNVELHMGYLGHLQLMVTGTFTTMAPRFAAGGASTLEVRGLNVLHQLRRRKYSDHWLDKTRSEVAELVGSRRRRGNDDTRLDLPLCINERARSNEEPIPIITQNNLFDIDFLWTLARQEGYVVVIREATETYPRHLYFGPSGGVSSCDSGGGGGAEEWQDASVLRLEWGRSLIDCTPQITSANQFRSVTVRGWDRRRQRQIAKTVTLEDRELQRMNPDLHQMINVCDPREEQVVDLPVFTEREAENRARAIFLDQLRQMVKISATTIGLPSLRAGASVDIAGLGARLSGRYFVTKTSHTINDAGYLTRFEARREHDPGQAA
jgi:phage protein D